MALAPSGTALLLGMSDGSLRRFQLDTSGPSPRVIETTGALALALSPCPNVCAV